MKIKIGPYKNWIGPYQIADLFQYVGASEDRCYKIGDWLASTWVKPVCEWLHKKSKRKISIKIDNYDVWSMDHTLALIIHPMLIELNRVKHGAPFIDDEDVPEHLRSTSAKPKDSEYDVDEFHFARWDWVMSEMIWAFGAIINDGKSCFFDHTAVDEKSSLNEQVAAIKIDEDGLAAFEERKTRALVFFGKYFHALWD